MTESILQGIHVRQIDTDRLSAQILERPAATDQITHTVVFVHGNVSSAVFWQPMMLAMPAHERRRRHRRRGSQRRVRGQPRRW